MRVVEIIQVYKCFCDPQRLRILNLLREGPLCGCHLVEILGSDQVKVSKQLRYMKDLGMVEAERDAQWRVYRLAGRTSPLLEENLKCLQDCAGGEIGFAADLRKRAALIKRARAGRTPCPEVVTAGRGM